MQIQHFYHPMEGQLVPWQLSCQSDEVIDRFLLAWYFTDAEGRKLGQIVGAAAERSTGGRWISAFDEQLTLEEREEQPLTQAEFSLEDEFAPDWNTLLVWATWGSRADCILKVAGVSEQVVKDPPGRGVYLDLQTINGVARAQDGATEIAAAAHYIDRTDGLVLGRIESANGLGSVIVPTSGDSLPLLCSSVLCDFSLRNHGDIGIATPANVGQGRSFRLWMVDIPYPQAL